MTIGRPMIITTIVVTRNRPEDLKMCLKAILRNSIESQIIVVDQSNLKIKKENKRFVINYRKINYLPQYIKGKSRGLNYALKNVKTTYVAFTDDDCIPDKYWLENITKRLGKNKNIGGVFGRTLPYHPDKHPEKTCPSVFENKKHHLIKKPGRHFLEIGFGNNMAYRMHIFKSIGNFKAWLGPGSIGSNAEDAEMALRTLINKIYLYYDPEVVVYHNRFLDSKTMKQQVLSYTCGEIACYFYFALQGFEFARCVITDNIKAAFENLKTIGHYVFTLNKLKFGDSIVWPSLMVLARLRGGFVGLAGFIYDRYAEKNIQ